MEGEVWRRVYRQWQYVYAFFNTTSYIRVRARNQIQHTLKSGRIILHVLVRKKQTKTTSSATHVAASSPGPDPKYVGRRRGAAILVAIHSREQRWPSRPCHRAEVAHQRHQAVHDAHHSEPYSLELREERVMRLRVRLRVWARVRVS